MGTEHHGSNATITVVHWLLLVLMFSFLYWALPRGYDTFDEGIALLHANPDQLQIYQPIQSGPLLNLFVNYNDASVMTYRWLRFWFLFTCTGLLIASFYLWVQRHPHLAGVKNIFIASVMPALLLSGFISYVNAPFALHYNHIVYGLMALMFALALMDTGRSKTGSLTWVAIGAVGVLLLYIKWPSAIAALFVLFLYRVVLTRKNLIAVVIFLLTGIAAGYLLQGFLSDQFNALSSPETKKLLNTIESEVSGGMADSVSSLKDIGAGNSYIFVVLKNYLLDIQEFIAYLLSGKVIFLVLAAVSMAIVSTKAVVLLLDRDIRIFSLILVSILIAILVSELPRHPYSLIYAGIIFAIFTGMIVSRSVSTEINATKAGPGHFKLIPLIVGVVSLAYIVLDATKYDVRDVYLLPIVLGLAALALALFWRPLYKALQNTPYDVLITSLLFFIAPFCIAFGHDGGFVVHLMYGVPFWLITIILFLALTKDVEEESDIAIQKRIVSVGTLTMSAIILVQVAYNSTFKPYHTATTLIQQNHNVVNLPKMDGIKLDSINQKFFSDLGELINREDGLSGGRPLLVVGSMPGMVVALSSYSPGHLWYTKDMKFGFGNHNISGDMCDNFIQSVNVYGLPDILILEQDLRNEGVTECLGKIGFPVNYTALGSYDWLDYRVNKPNRIVYLHAVANM